MRLTVAIGLVIVAALVTARVASADGLRTTPIGFDHMVHDRNIVANGGDSVPCARCHVERAGKLIGRPDHFACFGSCHGPKPVAPRAKQKVIVGPDQLKLCTTCHSEAALAAPYGKTLAVTYPPFTFDPDFGLSVSHKGHRAIACAQCHADPRNRTPHARCLTCHDGLTGHGPTMSKCQSCHQAAAGKPQPPVLVAATLPIATTFSHKTHAQRSAAGKACATCHAEILETDDNTLPRPSAKTCAAAGCHDAKVAFSITTAACTKCHRDPPQRTFHIIRPTARFSHAKHDSAKLPCASCHRLAASGEIIAGDHEACSGCHDDFGSATPKICGACHNTTEPWRALTVDRAPAEVSEFGASLDHGKHATNCISCHRLRTTRQELRPARGHASCTGAGCHAVTAGPPPQLGMCETCHQVGLATTREATRSSAAWSVRGGFSHTAAHRFASDGKAIPCERCHDDLSSVTVLSLATPKKSTCMPCHDGTAAFKLTGTTCLRCHKTKP